MTDPGKPRIRRLAPKVRTGCTTCKRRRVKCDERKPFCLRCENLGVTCDGYAVPKPWLFESQSSTTPSGDERPGDSTKDDTTSERRSDISKPSGPGSRHELLTRLSYSLDPYRGRFLFPSDEPERLLLLQSYVRLTAQCPVAWETDLYRTSTGPAGMKDTDIILLHKQDPVTRIPHLAMAAATLHLFHPEIYPFQLQLKYSQLAIAEVRRRIIKQKFDVSDLLHGISQIFMAAVLQGDEVAARAHLTAAKRIVNQCGGLDAIRTTTAQALKYGDLHLAVETISSPVFPIVVDVQSRYDVDNISVIDPTIRVLSEELCRSATSQRRSLSAPLVQCFCNFAECAIALTHAWADPPPELDLDKVEWIAAKCLCTLNILLKLSKSTDITTAVTQEDARHTLILWIQLLGVLANSTIIEVDTRSNTTTISNKELSSYLSPAVRYGLMEWNSIVFAAKKEIPMEKTSDDWLKLVDVVTEMEREQPVHVSPLIKRLLDLRRPSRIPIPH